MNDLKKHLKENYGVVFENDDLLFDAFTHSSYVNEHRNSHLNDNERLEFLGDAVLEIAVSNYLYHTFDSYPEGLLTRMRSDIVREKSLYHFCLECGFDQFVRLGKGEEMNKGRQRPSLLADLFESFLGSLYLDQNLTAADQFLAQVVYPKIKDGVFSHGMDYKTTLQEYLQQDGEIAIHYDIVDTQGPAHDRFFIAEVRVEGEVYGQGKGRTKKLAEQSAAQVALDKIKQTDQ